MFTRKHAPDTINPSANTQPESALEAAPPPEETRRSFPFHPLLIAAFPILTLYAHNIDEVPLHDVWRPLGLALLGTVAVWALVGLLTRHLRRAALAASVTSLLFFSFGHLANLLPEDWRSLLAPICLIGLVILLIVLCRSRNSLASLTVGLNLTSLALVIPSLLTIAPHAITQAQAAGTSSTQSRLISAREETKQPTNTAKTVAQQPAPASPAKAKDLPDVYYIILDAYGRDDSLRNFYGYDNTLFLKELEKRGFYIARHSRANYAQTGYCLPTSLNMRYLNDLLKSQPPAENLFESLRKNVDENAVAANLRPFGYRYVEIWTGSTISRADSADLALYDDKLAAPSSFEGQVFSLSALDALPKAPQEKIPYADEYERHRAFILTAFHNLDTVATLPYPKFVFAHILAPHPPFVFGPNGEPLNPRRPYTENDGSQLLQSRKFSKEEYQRGYIGQLQYINRRVLESVDAIQRQSKRPPIIIIQGDHGSRMNVDWDSQAKTDLREPFSILNAYYVPSQMKRHLYDTITPVNSFRLMLTDVFGLNYPLLPDRSFFSTPDHPMNFAEVTHSIPEFPETVAPEAIAQEDTEKE